MVPEPPAARPPTPAASADLAPPTTDSSTWSPRRANLAIDMVFVGLIVAGVAWLGAAAMRWDAALVTLTAAALGRWGKGAARPTR